jgi:hypothetical protein
METMICNDGHPVIHYRQKDCPACYLKEEIGNLQKANRDLATRLKRCTEYHEERDRREA